ncbi:hypothetical protein Cni_G01398 [Canna indica]|uniref:Uncharacterized protein n=1 Tax=Canna indica TaxID=4628 RepID=A0AAQ3Q1Q8_9LILI|nr:hypothetical protein Cni_G01398 [Canna indica]
MLRIRDRNWPGFVSPQNFIRRRLPVAAASAGEVDHSAVAAASDSLGAGRERRDPPADEPLPALHQLNRRRKATISFLCGFLLLDLDGWSSPAFHGHFAFFLSPFFTRFLDSGEGCEVALVEPSSFHAIVILDPFEHGGNKQGKWEERGHGDRMFLVREPCVRDFLKGCCPPALVLVVLLHPNRKRSLVLFCRPSRGENRGKRSKCRLCSCGRHGTSCHDSRAMNTPSAMLPLLPFPSFLPSMLEKIKNHRSMKRGRLPWRCFATFSTIKKSYREW